MIRPTLAQMLRNPVYMQADLDVYEFFKSQGTMIVNDAADFTGMNGCYLYQGRDVKPDKLHSLKDQMLVLAPHEGIVPSEIWLIIILRKFQSIIQTPAETLPTITSFGRHPKSTYHLIHIIRTKPITTPRISTSFTIIGSKASFSG